MSDVGVGVGVGVDNDALLKATAYGLTGAFWPPDADPVGVLGAARFVLRAHITDIVDADSRDGALAAVDAAVDAAVTLEPHEDELRLAAALEAAAQRRGVPFDTGESVLTAIVVSRDVRALETGDKRAIAALEAILDDIDALDAVAGRVRCLEQVVARAVAAAITPDALAQAICARPGVDKTLSICCSCYAPPAHGHRLDHAALTSYIDALRRRAPRVLAA